MSTPQAVESVADSSQPGAFSGYGTVASTQYNFPRQVQLSLNSPSDALSLQKKARPNGWAFFFD